MTQKDLNILNDLFSRIESLPDILHLRAAEIGYKLTEDDKILLFDTYQKLDDILQELAAFINVKFPSAKRHIKSWNDIDFDTKIGEIKIATTDREHIKRAWNKGMYDLKNLIKTLRHETLLLIDDDNEQNNIDKTQESKINNFNGNIIYNEESNRGNQNINSEINKQKQHKSWLEILSWVTGILAALYTVYQAFKS